MLLFYFNSAASFPSLPSFQKASFFNFSGTKNFSFLEMLLIRSHSTMNILLFGVEKTTKKENAQLSSNLQVNVRKTARFECLLLYSNSNMAENNKYNDKRTKNSPSKAQLLED